MQPTSVLVTVAGPDRPGVTSSVFSALAAFDVDVRDVEQVVVRRQLILAVLVELRGEVTPLRGAVEQAARALDLTAEVAVLDPPDPSGRIERPSRTHVTVIGRPLRAGALSHITQRIADLGANVDSISQLGVEPASTVDLLVSSRDPARLRAELVGAADDIGVDIAVEPAGFRRRATRLVLFDVDSTVVRDAAMRALAERAGVGGEVADLERRAAAGELDVEASLRARVALLAGLSVTDLETVRAALRLTTRTRAFVRTLRRLGYQLGVVSDGFTFVTDWFVAELDLDFGAANELELVDGVVTGRLVGDIVDRPGKARALRRFADEYRVPLSQTVAVGDGADDVDLLDTAGLGIAFTGRALSGQQNDHRAGEAASAALDEPYLDTLQFVLGISDEDVQAAVQAD